MKKIIILFAIALVGLAACNSTPSEEVKQPTTLTPVETKEVIVPPPQGEEIIKRLNRTSEILVKEIIEKINTPELWEQPHAWEKVELLVEYKEAALPLIFRILDRETAKASPEWTDKNNADLTPRTP